MLLLPTSWLAFFVCSLFALGALAQEEEQQLLQARQPAAQSQYKVGEPIPVSCLNRTIETGEHITDEQGQLQYIPFPTCNETGRPLELYFGIERGSPLPKRILLRV